MEILKRLIGIYLIVIALAVSLNWMVTPLIDNSSGDYPIWVALNWFMAPAVALALIVNVIRKLRLWGNEGAGITRAYLEVNLAFYASIVLTLWWFWNWFHSLFPENEPDVVGLIHLEWWAFINPLIVLVLLVTGFHLWKGARDNQ